MRVKNEIQTKLPTIAIATSVVGGMDYRGGETLGDTIWPGIDGGIYLRGYADSVEFVLDARIYADFAERAPKRYAQVHTRQVEDLGKAVDFILKPEAVH